MPQMVPPQPDNPIIHLRQKLHSLSIAINLDTPTAHSNWGSEQHLLEIGESELEGHGWVDESALRTWDAVLGGISDKLVTDAHLLTHLKHTPKSCTFPEIFTRCPAASSL